MAKILTKAGITTGNTVEAFHVTQSIDAFTGIDAYDISLSGSFNMTGSINGEPGVVNPLTASYAVTASYADNALSSSYAITASYALNSPSGVDTNFANTNLTFDGNRSHNTDGNDLFISVDGNFGTTTVTDAFLGIQAAELTLGFSQSAQTQYVASGITHTGNTSVVGTLDVNSNTTITGSLNNGSGNTSSGNLSHAEGFATIASGLASHAEGNFTTASGSFSHAEGEQTRAIGFNSHAEGNRTLATGAGSHAEGYFTTSSGTYAHAEGQQTFASGGFSHAEGYFTIASGNYAHAEGQLTLASFTGAHAEGTLTTASGQNSHAEGAGSVASGSFSHAEGGYYSGPFVVRGGTAIGPGSHAEGVQTLASGLGSHAEGYLTTASGDYAHSQGGVTQAIGDYSLACGAFSIAYKDYSSAFNASFSSGSYQTTVGINNVRSENDSSSTGDAFIVGNGPLIGSPSNAFRVSGSGECFSGTTFTNGGADYAEYFESHDGQAIPLGTVVELTGSYIKACETADNAIGVISNKPSVLGNAEEGTADQWVGMYLKDEWGNYSYEPYTFEDPIKVDENGDPITQTGTRKVLNPKYDPSLPYTPRSSRPEWNVVGLLGQIKVLKNQNIPSRWIKMKDINDAIAIYLVK